MGISKLNSALGELELGRWIDNTSIPLLPPSLPFSFPLSAFHPPASRFSVGRGGRQAHYRHPTLSIPHSHLSSFPGPFDNNSERPQPLRVGGIADSGSFEEEDSTGDLLPLPLPLKHATRDLALPSVPSNAAPGGGSGGKRRSTSGLKRTANFNKIRDDGAVYPNGAVRKKQSDRVMSGNWEGATPPNPKQGIIARLAESMEDKAGGATTGKRKQREGEKVAADEVDKPKKKRLKLSTTPTGTKATAEFVPLRRSPPTASSTRPSRRRSVLSPPSQLPPIELLPISRVIRLDDPAQPKPSGAPVEPKQSTPSVGAVNWTEIVAAPNRKRKREGLAGNALPLTSLTSNGDGEPVDQVEDEPETRRKQARLSEWYRPVNKKAIDDKEIEFVAVVVKRKAVNGPITLCGIRLRGPSSDKERLNIVVSLSEKGFQLEAVEMLTLWKDRRDFDILTLWQPKSLAELIGNHRGQKATIPWGVFKEKENTSFTYAMRFYCHWLRIERSLKKLDGDKMKDLREECESFNYFALPEHVAREYPEEKERESDEAGPSAGKAGNRSGSGVLDQAGLSAATSIAFDDSGPADEDGALRDRGNWYHPNEAWKPVGNRTSINDELVAHVSIIVVTRDGSRLWGVHLKGPETEGAQRLNVSVFLGESGLWLEADTGSWTSPADFQSFTLRSHISLVVLIGDRLGVDALIPADVSARSTNPSQEYAMRFYCYCYRTVGFVEAVEVNAKGEELCGKLEETEG